MTILQPGEFRVADYRKAIPTWVKVVAAVRLVLAMIGEGRHLAISLTEFVRDLQYDHRPPLQDRPYDTTAGDFIPPQNDPMHIEAICTDDHLQRTTGRKPGAATTVTTRGSDLGEAAHARRVKDNMALHEAAMAEKQGDKAGARRILASVRPSRLKPKRKIANRGFAKGHRPLRGRARHG